jgi:hypothetical protein
VAIQRTQRRTFMVSSTSRSKEYKLQQKSRPKASARRYWTQGRTFTKNSTSELKEHRLTEKRTWTLCKGGSRHRHLQKELELRIQGTGQKWGLLAETTWFMFKHS